MNVDAHTQILAAATFLPQHIPHLPLSPAVWHSMPSFTQRKGSGYIFHQPSSVQGYLSQINQWARTIFEWDIQEIKPDHTNPDGSTKKYFIATPIFNEETLYEFQATGYTVKSAKEAASECMVKRDFCVSLCILLHISLLLTLSHCYSPRTKPVVNYISFTHCYKWTRLSFLSFLT
ncbi:hypothetical protein C8Q75DRAFT_447419 [Abortiporus biennis]|nr:hypothetical protein C8Q75DRAFT_447419 [Abortiporus biennis]